MIQGDYIISDLSLYIVKDKILLSNYITYAIIFIIERVNCGILR